MVTQKLCLLRTYHVERGLLHSIDVRCVRSSVATAFSTLYEGVLIDRSPPLSAAPSPSLEPYSVSD